MDLMEIDAVQRKRRRREEIDEANQNAEENGLAKLLQRWWRRENMRWKAIYAAEDAQAEAINAGAFYDDNDLLGVDKDDDDESL